jgi:hypothetical protein
VPEHTLPPWYLYAFYPSPGSVTISDQLNQKTEINQQPVESGVCLRVRGHRLPAEFGFELTPEEWVSSSSLILNGTPILEKSIVAISEDQYQFCFPADLGLGVHTVTFIIHPDENRKLEYSWYFLVVE